MKILKLLLLLTLILLVDESKAQGQYHVRYGYDDCGNRITRNIISVIKSKKIEANYSELEVHNPTLEQIIETPEGELKVVAFPNPVVDKLTLKLEGNLAGTMVYELQNTTGQILLKSPISLGVQQIDLTNYASGIYFIGVRLNEANETIQFKVIKR